MQDSLVISSSELKNTSHVTWKHNDPFKNINLTQYLIVDSDIAGMTISSNFKLHMPHF